MSSWLDRWAKRAAEAPPTPLSDAEMSASPDVARPASSRRDFLKKAGIVGGVAWSVPVLQTVMAPAHAASNTQLGDPCNDLNICANGAAYCSGTTCGGVGAQCPAGSGVPGQCVASSPCSQRPGGPFTCGGPRAACTTNAQCTHGNCSTDGYCGGTGAPCGADTQCASAVGQACQNDGTCKKYNP
jgi:hypothetical protein